MIKKVEKNKSCLTCYREKRLTFGGNLFHFGGEEPGVNNEEHNRLVQGVTNLENKVVKNRRRFDAKIDSIEERLHTLEHDQCLLKKK